MLVTSDIERITIRTNWTNAVSERHEVRLEEIADPIRLGLLKSVFADPERLRPGTTRAALTAKAAADFAELAGRLRSRGNDPQGVAHFVNRLVFCLFADDVGSAASRAVRADAGCGAQTAGAVPGLCAVAYSPAMAERGGEVDFTPVAWFNGGLFDDGAALPLEADDIALLQRAAALDWAEVDPSILGTLFERGLDPDKRSQLGAHYTSREMIERLIEPVVRRPLLAEWGEVQRADRGGAGSAGTAAKVGSKAKRDAPRRAETLFRGFLDRLRAFRVLDPACGSGNFLYLALLALKDLEHQAMVEAEAIGLQREFPQVGPEAVLGLEVNPYAAELARVSVWIGHIQWARRHGFPAPSDPVLRTLDTIACRDAVLADDGSQAAWPDGGRDRWQSAVPWRQADAHRVGGCLLRPAVRRLRRPGSGRGRPGLLLGCEGTGGDCRRQAIWCAGLVTTNSIRGGANRRVLEPMAQAGAISTAWADEPWTLDGAAVRVSLVCWGHDRPRISADAGHGVAVPAIHADLTAGAANLTTARRLSENAGVAFMGDTKGGAFDVPGELARQWLLLPSNANRRPNADVLRPWANGMDVTRRPSDTWIIDFGWTMTEAEAAYYAAPYAYIAQHVRPVRATNKREAYARTWWRHVEARPGMHHALAGLPRFVVTPRVAKHRTFSWLAHPTLPDTRLFALARDDDTFFGILHSRIHEVWSLATASWHGVGNDPTYNATVCFETFPFPAELSPASPAISYANDTQA